jgi:glucosamine-6-phosphate deaminase
MIELHIKDSKAALGAAAAERGAEALKTAIAQRGIANLVVATGASQFETIAALVARDDIAWDKVTAFHLDEYVGMSETHKASFRRYLKERFASVLPQVAAFHFIAGDAPDVTAEAERLGALIAGRPIDVTFAGIGENAHLAFNDPPADFDARTPFKVVDLDEPCRRQQLGEGWFDSFEDVPKQAISMTVPQIVKSGAIVLSVSDTRKAQALKDTLEGPVTPHVPASILQNHGASFLYADTAAASLLA